MDRRAFLGMIPALPVLVNTTEAKAEAVDKEPWPPEFPEGPVVTKFTKEEFDEYNKLNGPLYKDLTDKEEENWKNWYHVRYFFNIPKRLGGSKYVRHIWGHYVMFRGSQAFGFEWSRQQAKDWYDSCDWDKLAEELKKNSVTKR